MCELNITIKPSVKPLTVNDWPSVRVQSCLTKRRASFRKKKMRRKSDFCGMIKILSL